MRTAPHDSTSPSPGAISQEEWVRRFDLLKSSPILIREIIFEELQASKKQN